MADGLFRQERSYAELVTGLGHDEPRRQTMGIPRITIHSHRKLRKIGCPATAR
jgi:hypothetical protein